MLPLFNLLSEFRRASGITQHKEPGTLRSQIFLCGAELKQEGDEIVLTLAAGWGRLKRRLPSKQQLGLVFSNLSELTSVTVTRGKSIVKLHSPATVLFVEP